MDDKLDFTKHIVNEGQKDYKPGHGSKLTFGVKGFTLVFSLDESAWFDPSADGPLNGYRGWSKIGGVSYLHPLRPKTWPKNSNSAMIAWRPSPDKGYFEICAYTNLIGGGHITSDFVKIKAGAGGAATVKVGRRHVDYIFQGVSVRHEIRRFGIAVPVGPWFGGTENSPNRHFMYTDYNIIK